MFIITVLTVYLLYRACKKVAQARREGDPHYWVRKMDGEAYANPLRPKPQFSERYRFLVPTEITEKVYDNLTD